MTDGRAGKGAVGSSRTRSALHARPVPQQAGHAALTIAALGVVFGDLGTSPLYTLQACLSGAHGLAPTEQNVLGVLSIIFWSLMLVITIKYLAFLMRTDNAGEGGIMALLALTPERHRHPAPGKVGLVALLVIAGAALLFGDGIITPAVSVLSAVEGLEVASPALKRFVVPLTVTILLLLFAVQSRGTAKLGRLFGPVMLVWFLTLAGLGLYRVVQQPSVLVALSPAYAARYFLAHGLGGIAILGGVVLCVTGGEALYADMGHFGRVPIQNAWLYICLPSLVLAYFGQGALVLAEHDPAARLATAARPFYALCPEGPWLYALVALATLATIIASQALISGVFSLTHQAIQLGYFPRLSVRHTSDDTEGQIYLPLMNWGLAVSCIALVLMFQASDRLASAYGLAVSGTMTITSIVYFVVLRQTRNWPLWKAGLVVGLFLATDIPFLVANASKFWEGGYVPFAVAMLFVVLMTNWRVGRSLSGDLSRQAAEPLERLAATLDERVKIRLPGTVVFMSANNLAPPALGSVIDHFGALHETVLVLTQVIEHVPHVTPRERAQDVLSLPNGFRRIALHYGFMEEPDLHGDLCTALSALGISTPMAQLLYVVGRESYVAGPGGRMGTLAEKLFAFQSRNARSSIDYFGLPTSQVVEVGSHVDL